MSNEVNPDSVLECFVIKV